MPEIFSSEEDNFQILTRNYLQYRTRIFCTLRLVSFFLWWRTEQALAEPQRSDSLLDFKKENKVRVKWNEIRLKWTSNSVSSDPGRWFIIFDLRTPWRVTHMLPTAGSLWVAAFLRTCVPSLNTQLPHLIFLATQGHFGKCDPFKFLVYNNSYYFKNFPSL